MPSIKVVSIVSFDKELTGPGLAFWFSTDGSLEVTISYPPMDRSSGLL